MEKRHVLQKRIEKSICDTWMQFDENTHYRNFEITESEHPDFIINDAPSIWLEITEFAFEYDKKIEKYLSVISGMPSDMHNCEAEKIFKWGIREQVGCVVGEKPAVIAKSRNLEELFFENKELIIHKIKKYQDDVINGQKLILLCDGRKNVFLTKEEECDDILEGVENDILIPRNLEIDLMWDDNFGTTMLKKYNKLEG